MKLLRQKPAPSTDLETPPAEPKHGMFRECLADLRGRPRPVTPKPEAPPPRIDATGVDVDEEGFERMRRHYTNPYNN